MPRDRGHRAGRVGGQHRNKFGTMPWKAPSPEPSGTLQDVLTQDGERAFPPMPRGQGQAILPQAFLTLGQCSAHSRGPVPKEGRESGASHSRDATPLWTGKGVWASRQSPTCQPVTGPWCRGGGNVDGDVRRRAWRVDHGSGGQCRGRMAESTNGGEMPIWRGGDPRARVLWVQSQACAHRKPTRPGCWEKP